MIRGIIFPTTYGQRPHVQHRAESSAARLHCEPARTRNGPATSAMSGRAKYEPGQKTIRGIVFPAIGVYLAVILDLHSRRVIGWAIGNRMKKGLAIRALNMAIALRRPPKGCIHHTDRGSPILFAFAIVLEPMARSAVESVFKSPKAEPIWRRNWHTRRAVEVVIFDYINGFYNPRRRHSATGWKSPVAFERKAA